MQVVRVAQLYILALDSRHIPEATPLQKFSARTAPENTSCHLFADQLLIKHVCFLLADEIDATFDSRLRAVNTLRPDTSQLLGYTTCTPTDCYSCISLL